MKNLLLTLLACSLVAGCGTLSEKKKEKTLSETTLFYENAIRWTDFAAATRYQRLPAGTANPPLDPATLKVTGYRQTAARPLADGMEVMLSVQIDYYYKDTLTVHTLQDRQLWRYDDQDETWYITTPLPDFR